MSDLSFTRRAAKYPESNAAARRAWPWPRSVRQARTHAVLAIVVLWTAAIVTLTVGPGNRSIAGPLKGTDFVHFYTIGSLARTHRTSALYDVAALHRAQVAVVPESSTDLYLPVYPPQTALLFAPFSLLPYRDAMLLWTLITVAAFGLIVWRVWRSVAHAVGDGALVACAAAAFPPFWSLVLHGQTTIVVLAAFCAGWIALERGRKLLAGVALGVLLIKPQLAIPLAVVVLASGEWGMLAGAVISIAAQAVVVVAVLGRPVLQAYAAFVPVALAHADLLDPKPFQVHSLEALTTLAPGWIGRPLWFALAGAVLFVTVRIWRSRAPLHVRFGIVMFASVLVSPHLNVYDATILAPPLIWFAGYVRTHRSPAAAARYGRCVYWLFATLLAPTAAAIGLQASVLLMLGLLLAVARWVALDALPQTADRGSPAAVVAISPCP